MEEEYCDEYPLISEYLADNYKHEHLKRLFHESPVVNGLCFRNVHFILLKNQFARMLTVYKKGESIRTII